MKKFEFNGDWSFKLELPAFEIFKEKSNSEYQANGFFHISILDELNDNPDPKPEQLASLIYLYNNDTAIVEALHKAAIERRAYFAEIWKIDPDSDEMADQIPRIDDICNLNRVLEVDTIEIGLTSYHGFAHVYILGLFDKDEEHGLEIVLWKNEVKSMEATAEMERFEIEDGEEEMEYRLGYYSISNKFKHPDFNVEAEQFLLPLSKYGKFKPWQIEYNRALFKYLLQEVKHQYLLKEKLFSSEFNVANHAIGFVDEAVLSEKDEIAFELLNKGAKAFYAISYVLKRSDPNFELYTELKKKYEKFPYAFDSAGRGIIYSLLEFINSKKYKSQFEKEQIEDDIIFCVKNGAWYESEGQMNLRTYASDYNWQIAKAFEESSRNPFLETYEEYSGDTLESVHSYRNGLMDGTWYSYINKGEIRSKTVYDYGVLKYRHEREYENWKFTGKETITRTEEDNIVIKEVRMNDVLQLRETKNKQKGWFKKEEYYETGDLHKVTETENGFGSKVGYYKTGVKEAEGKVKNGAAVGLWYFFRENGDKLAEAVYSGDSLTWEETRFHENGTRSFKQIVVKGKKNGPFVAFDENGVKRTEGSYLNDQYHGAFNEYYPTGKLYYSGSYSEGKKSGSWVSYDENGKTIHRHLYGKESQGVEAREAPSKGRKSLTNTNQLLLIIFLVLLVLVIVLSIFK